jgi:phosphomannomutase
MNDPYAHAERWLVDDPDPATRDELRALLERRDDRAIADRFGARLEFGTAGLRGVLGAGPNRMNRAVVIRTTAGLCAYLRAKVVDVPQRGVVVGYDGRRMSREFARDVAAVVAAAGITAHVFEELVPTPLVAHAVKHLGAAAGVMITASHNPPEYNGYKVYWGNGAQIVPPHDEGISAAIEAVPSVASVARDERSPRIVVVPAGVREAYLTGVEALSPVRASWAPLTMVYTALHGVGGALATRVLARWGIVHPVREQAEPDGAFPTVAFPNPEEKGALDLAVALAKRVGADVVLAHDPDADRLAVAVPCGGEWVQLSGNDVGVLLGHHLLMEGDARGERLVAMSVVSSPLLGIIARRHGVRCEETLTGFKWIANRAMELEHATGARFVFGYEEALGYTVGTLVRDKDGVGAAYVLAGLAAMLKHRGETLLSRLEAIHREYGFFASGQRNVTARGADGMTAIRATMQAFRERPLTDLAGLPVVAVRDYQTGVCTRPDGTSTPLTLPPSNLIAYDLSDGSRVMLRPSGTEPKIKYYFDVREELSAQESYADGAARAKEKLQAVIDAFAQASKARGGL